MIDVDQLQATVNDMDSKLSGLVATDIWDRESGTSLAGLRTQPAAVALFNEMTVWMDNTLQSSGFPSLKQYYMLELEGDTLVVIIKHGDDILQGILCNSRMTNLGTLLSLGLRTAIDGVAAARRVRV